MNKFVQIGLGAVALVVVAVIGAQLLGPPAPGGVGGAPSPSPTATPTATPTAVPSIPKPSGTPVAGLPVGSSYLLINEGVRGNVTVPAPGWYGDGGIIARDDVDAPAGAGIITFTGDLYVYGDPCAWSTTAPTTPAATVDAFIDALAAQADRDATPAVDVTVGGYAGKSITLHVPDDAVFNQCDQGYFGSWGGPDEPTPSRYSQSPGQIDEIWALDVDGILTVIDTAYYAGTPVEHVEELRAIIESTTFE